MRFTLTQLIVMGQLARRKFLPGFPVTVEETNMDGTVAMTGFRHPEDREPRTTLVNATGCTLNLDDIDQPQPEEAA